MNAPLSKTPPQIPSRNSSALLDKLETAFGCSFGVWQRSPGPHGGQNWSEVSRGGKPAGRHLGEPQIADWLDGLLANNASGACLLPLGPEQAFVAIVSESERGERELVGGPIVLDPWRLAQACANLTVEQLRHTEQEQMLEHYATRLSASFEELCFLRKLSKHVDYCVADRPLADVALAILPEIRQLIEVEALCVIQASCDETTGAYRAVHLWGFDGELPFDARLCCQVVDQLGAANRRVLVRNYCGELVQADNKPGVHVPAGLKSLVVVPVEKAGTVFGWLVGINKQLDGPFSLTSSKILGHDELGSMQATLLEASALMLGSHANNHLLFQDLEKLFVDIIHTLVGAIEARDAYTSGHSDRVALMGRRLALQLGLGEEQCQDIFLAGLLHDIGKIGISDHILQKPGRLTEEEFAAIKTHPEIGARLLRGLRPLEKLLPGVLHHHESVDGTGYPHGLKGDEIPLMARILAVADAFDAMTSDRPYREGMPMGKAQAILRSGRGTQWDATVVDAFFAVQNDLEQICQHYKGAISTEPTGGGGKSTVGQASVVPLLETPVTGMGNSVTA
jgi:HD-GYP domain-containing protein (c-di-GMP phosphodiesterase class II)